MKEADLRETSKIRPGPKPRETLENRIREQYCLPADSIFFIERGEDINMLGFDGKVHVPSTRDFSHMTFYNPATSRTSNIYSCDHAHCGKHFRKWNNLFDHLRTHTLEKPYICPVDGCHMTFN